VLSDKANALRLNLYIHDYLLKHRLPNAAAALSSEAGLNETRVPVEAPEGLLYESVIPLVANLADIIRWWCVFWDVFTANKHLSGGQDGPPAAASYTEVSCDSAISRKLTFRQSTGSKARSSLSKRAGLPKRPILSSCSRIKLTRQWRTRRYGILRATLVLRIRQVL
jgi:hypothetical protein